MVFDCMVRKGFVLHGVLGVSVRGDGLPVDRAAGLVDLFGRRAGVWSWCSWRMASVDQ
jgi:hypothetical protein